MGELHIAQCSSPTEMQLEDAIEWMNANKSLLFKCEEQEMVIAQCIMYIYICSEQENIGEIEWEM